MDSLIKYSRNIYSQFGEDGIIEKVFEIIGTRSRLCIELGAWDGLHYSNSANLWKNGWKAILIESSIERYKLLVKNTQNYDCVCLNLYVQPEGQNNLENILSQNQISFAIDMLSIDIDGDDYYIFESLNNLKPRLIICEYNPTIPYWMDFIPEKSNYIGCSVSSLIRLANSKGYQLIAITDTNCFFVRDELLTSFNGYETNIASIAVNKYLTYFITGYDGKYLLSQRPPYGISGPYMGHITGDVYQGQVSTSHKQSILWKAMRFLGLGKQ